MNAVNHEVRGIASSFSDSNSLSPENLRENFAPLRLVSLTSLHDSLANIKMLGLNYPVSLGVVSRNPNVMDFVLLSKEIDSGNIGSGVIGDNLVESSPATGNLLKDKARDNFG